MRIVGTRVGDRSVTNSSNEADGDGADQPRLSFPQTHPSDSGTVAGSRRRFWVACVPIFLLLIVLLAIQQSSEVRTPPPPMQTFVRPPSKLPLPRVNPPPKKRPEPLVRVNVTPGGVESFQFEIRGRYEFTSLESNQKMPANLDSGVMTVSATKTGLKLGSQAMGTNRLEIRPEQSPAIRVNGHLYRGCMRLFQRTDGKVSAVNVLPIEEYLASVVDSEMPAKFPEAARQAQAIVARTYALYQIEHADPKAMFDLLSSQRSQKYLGVEYLDGSGRRLAGESDSSRRAVEATHGVVCQRHQKLFCTYYSAVCGGQTTDGRAVFRDAIDVVKSVPCEWCRESPYYRWTTELSYDEFQSRVLDRGKQRNKKAVVQSIREQSDPQKGSISRFEIDDGQRPVSVTGIELRERLPPGTLSSPRFRIKLEKDRIVFEGQGHGHGVGFCQWGAKGQAEAGRDSLEIVRHYYPGAEIATLDY